VFPGPLAGNGGPCGSTRCRARERLWAISVRCSSVGPCLGQCPAVTLRPIASPTARNSSIGSNSDGLSGVEGKTAHVRPLTPRAGSSSSPWPEPDRVLRPAASRGPARRCRPIAPRPCDDQPPTPVFASTPGRPPASAGHAARSRLPESPPAAAAAQQTGGDRLGSSPTGTGPSTGIASGSRFRASSVARPMPNPSTCRGDPAPSASTAAQTSPAARRKAGPPRPPFPRCQHSCVAGSFTLPLTRHALPSSQKGRPTARTARTSRPG
jgi:hypothetical protein